jgi:catechol 2,3-dioxygenase-like lactoylglutathione lyase family enzyme
MLQKARAAALLPASDIARARAFYEGKLGLTPDSDYNDPTGGALYRCADGTGFAVFLSSGTSDASYTQIGFEVDDLDAEATDLRSKGVKLEEYDLPGIKTENGIADQPDGKGCWFKDTEGNLIGVMQRVPVPAAT